MITAHPRRLNGSILPIATLHPPHIVAALIAASKIESRIDYGECDERAAAVDAVVAQAKKEVPENFR